MNSVQQYHLFVSAAPKQDRNLKMKTLLPESIYILKLPIDFLIFFNHLRAYPLGYEPTRWWCIFKGVVESNTPSI